jgi:hypothetical protein
MKKITNITFYILATLGMVDIVGQVLTHGNVKIIHSILGVFFK